VSVILTSGRLGEHRQDTVGDVDGNNMQRVPALALSADAASGVASMDFRSDCKSSLGLISQKTELAEASAMLCQWEALALFVGDGGIELLEAPLS
jgi:hypothetical protein